jgi:hypothetical protein
MRQKQKQMMAQEMKVAITSVWLIISAILMIMFITLYLLPESALLAASGAFQLPHHDQKQCLLCGMTRAFIAISRGNLADAVTFNNWSVTLYGMFLVNELSTAIFLASRIRKFFLSHRAASHVERNPLNTRKRLNHAST